MTRRRGFGIDLPEAEGQGAPAPAPRPSRRGPMASAMRENVDSLRARGEVEAAVRAENDALAHELVRLRRAGLAVEHVALDRIDAAKLIRDRAVVEDPDVADLKDSIREIGLSNPIRLERAGERFELIQGWRRLAAYRALAAETGDPAYAAIPAAIEPEGEALEVSYRRMVDENLVRQDVSFAEMAELARAYAADPRTDVDGAAEAVTVLFRSASHQKRSYIRSFALLLDELGDLLRHPAAIPRNLGLEVRRRLVEEPGGREALRAALAAHPGREADQEVTLLRGFAGAGPDPEGPQGPRPGPTVWEGTEAEREAARLRLASRAGRIGFDVPCAEGTARCTVRGPKVELRAPRDLSRESRARLERAAAAFFAALAE